MRGFDEHAAQIIRIKQKILTARNRHKKIMSFLLHFLINYYSSFGSAAFQRPYRFSYLARYRILYIFERSAARLCAFEKYFTSIFSAANGRRVRCRKLVIIPLITQ